MKYNHMPLSVYDKRTCTIELIGITFADSELNWMWENDVRYIIKGRCLYEIRWSDNYKQHYYAYKIFTFDSPKVDRGRFFALTTHEVNASYKQYGVPELNEN